MKVFVKMGKARYAVCFVVVLSVLFAAGAVWASSEGGGSGLDKTKDLIWRTMNFVVLAGALIFLLRKPIAQALEARRQGIRDQLDDLEKQKQEAEKQLAEYKTKLSRLEQEVGAIVAEYVKQGEALKEKIIEEAKASAEKLQDLAKKNIEHEFDKAKQELRAEVADQAVAMAEALIKKNVNDEDQNRIIDEYLTKVVVAQ
jgi:F-type H+-transporting ATPase subunit b